MRVIIFLLLLLQDLQANGQAGTIRIASAEEAVAMAIRNTPSVQTDPGIRKLSQEIKSNWFKWLYQINQLKILQDHLNLLADIDRITALRYHEGDIDLLEKSRFVTKLAEIRTNTAIFKNEIEITGNLLKQLVNSREEIVPADTGLFMYQIKKGSGNDQHHPTPVDSIQVENLELKLDSYFTRLQFFNKTALEHARLILQINHAKFKAEEIDYLDFTSSASEAYDIELDYLKTLNCYNQTAIELEHYAY